MLNSKVHSAIQQVNDYLKNEGETPIPSLLSNIKNPFFFLEIDRIQERLKGDLDLEERVLLHHRLIFILFLKVKKGNNISWDVPQEAENHIKKREKIWTSYLELNQIDRKQLYFAYRVMLLEANRSITFKSTFPFEGSQLEKEGKLSRAISRRRNRLRKKRVVFDLPLEIQSQKEKKEEDVNVPPLEILSNKEQKEEQVNVPLLEVPPKKNEPRKCEAILKTGNRRGESCGVKASYQKGNSWVCGKHNK
jgi:hypothetical protein